MEKYCEPKIREHKVSRVRYYNNCGEHMHCEYSIIGRMALGTVKRRRCWGKEKRIEPKKVVIVERSEAVKRKEGGDVELGKY